MTSLAVDVAAPAAADDLTVWPSLGGEVCAWIETWCVHGPGDVRGRPVTLDPEERRFLWRAYEVYPRGHAKAGRRRYSRAAYIRRKGVRKTELAAWISCLELVGPCRADGFRRAGGVWVPVARPVTSPFIPVTATTLEHSEDTLWGAIYAIVSESDIGDEWGLDVGLDRIIEPSSGGEMKPVTSSSNARDGARPSFSPRDETHLWYSAGLRRVNDTLMRNLPKRPLADPWALSTTTAWSPGQGSVAEAESEEAAKAVPGLLWDMRQASEVHDLDTDEGLRAAILEASGDAAGRTDVDSIAAEYRRGSRAEGRRYWLCIPSALDADDSWLASHPSAWEECREDGLAELDRDGMGISVGVDSALRNDSVAVWALQPRPDGTVAGIARTWVAADGRTYDRAQIRNYLRDLCAGWPVKAVGYDPRFFESDAQTLVDEGLPMIEVPQSAERMVPACLAGYALIVDRLLRHDADDVAGGQVLAAVPRDTDGGWRLSKGRSLHKIDSAIALCIAEYVRVRVPDDSVDVADSVW